MRFHPGIQRQASAPRKGSAPTVVIGLLLAAMTLSAAAATTERRGRSGSEVVTTICATCHTKGENGAPRIGDKAAWAARASQGLTSLTAHALQGIRDMPSHGGNQGLSDVEVERAIIRMVNLSGGNWVEPLNPATPALARTGEQTVRQHCAQCHKDGLGGAPKIGDRPAWAPRMRGGMDALVASAVHGHGGMPPRGGVAELGDADIRDAVLHMYRFGIAKSPEPAGTRIIKATATDAPFHKVVAGTDVYLGIMKVRATGSGPMSAGAAGGDDQYHLNVSVFDAKTRSVVADARIELRVADRIRSETKMLEPLVANNFTSYGASFRMLRSTPYTITAQIRRPGFDGVAEAQFEYRPPN